MYVMRVLVCVVVLLGTVLVLLPSATRAKQSTGALVVSDLKEWKKLLKTHTNVLALFSNGDKAVANFLPTFDKVSASIRGKGTLVSIDCSAKDGKKICKNLKVKPSPYILKHFKDGSYHKDYDRLLQEKSLQSFMENPTADAPWSEDPSANDVRHLENPQQFETLLRKERKPVLTMFYAPWCGHCKRMKPEFATAATEVKGRYVLAGMDVDKPESYSLRQQLNISGFPTIVYFEGGQRK